MKTRLSAFLVSLLILISALEVSLRLFAPQESLYLYEFGPQGLRNRPGFADRHAMMPKRALMKFRNWWSPVSPGAHIPYAVRVHINSQGLRSDREFTFRKTNNGPRLLVLGDSISFGWPFESQFAYPSVIEKKWPGSEVVNCSVIGANTRYLRRLYEDRCSMFQADIVVLQITLAGVRTIPDYLWSDFAGADARIHDAVWNKTGRELTPVNADKPADLKDLSLDVRSPRADQRRLIERTYSPILPFYEAAHLIRFFENSFLISVTEHSPAVRRVENALSRSDVEKEVLEELNKGRHPTLESVDQIQALVRRQGAQFAVLIVPNAMALNIYRDSLEVPLFLRQLRLRSIPVIDLKSRLKERGHADLYLKDDVHPNQKGYDWIADQVIRDLKNLK